MVAANDDTTVVRTVVNRPITLYQKYYFQRLRMKYWVKKCETIQFLCNITAMDYKNIILKDNIWKEISIINDKSSKLINNTITIFAPMGMILKFILLTYSG